jgi:hypothetical protein
MDEDMRDKGQDEEEQQQQDPREAGGKKPGVETWPVVPGGKPGQAAE